MMIPAPPRLPSKVSIFPTARRLSALVLACLGIVGVVFGAVSWVSQVRSEYDALKLDVRKADAQFSDVAAERAEDRRDFEKQIGRCTKESEQLRIAISKVVEALEMRRGGQSLLLKDAKSALIRAEQLRWGRDDI